MEVGIRHQIDVKIFLEGVWSDVIPFTIVVVVVHDLGQSSCSGGVYSWFVVAFLLSQCTVTWSCIVAVVFSKRTWRSTLFCSRVTNVA